MPSLEWPAHLPLLVAKAWQGWPSRLSSEQRGGLSVVVSAGSRSTAFCVAETDNCGLLTPIPPRFPAVGLARLVRVAGWCGGGAFRRRLVTPFRGVVRLGSRLAVAFASIPACEFFVHCA